MHYYEYDIDQLQKEQQQDAYAHHCQQRWEQGYDDALAQVWNCCTTKSEDCSLYCNYLKGYLWGLEQTATQPADSEDCDEF